MLIRIFAKAGSGAPALEKYLNFLRLENKSGKPWTIEHCDPIKWSPKRGDIHIYVDIPVRLAVPWASYNVYATGEENLITEMTWNWAKTEMDLHVPMAALSNRDSALKMFRRMLSSAIKGQHPPMLPAEPVKGVPLPKVGIITLTRNRKSWWANMLQNVVKQKWPMSRIEWIIVDDGDEGERLNTEVEEFMEKSPGLVTRYVEMTTPRSIGAKRNAAVEAAGDDVDVFVCMDDDDHYPVNSIGERVAWLNRNIPDSKKIPQSEIGYCSVIPMYDVTRYISAMNVPELELSPAERVSEATLVFTRGAWLARPFPDVSMAEGLGFIEGREELTVEMSPNGIIVSFIHTKNSSSRRVPADQKPNGCHFGFSDEFFKYIHHIGGGFTVPKKEVVAEVDGESVPEAETDAKVDTVNESV